jgi:HEAT repeat protein
MNYLKKHLYYFVSATLLIMLGCSGSKDVDFEKADQLLKSIASYDYGQSRADLSELKAMIHKTYNTPDERLMEKKLISFIESDATFAGKQFICRQLSLIGTVESVPALKKLLLDPKTADIALYALQRIPAAEADKVLIEALNETEGKVKVGVINCLGERQTKAAVNSLAGLTTDSDEATARAAICALGKIANDEAAKVLSGTISRQTGALKTVSMDALLKCADTYAKRGKTAKALTIYRKYDNTKVPSTIRTAAIYGILKSDPQNAGNYTIKLLKGKDSAAKEIAIKELRNLDNKSQLKNIAALLPRLSAEHQVQLINALMDIGDPSVKSYILSAVKSKNRDVRVAALQALTTLGNAKDVFLLAAKAASGDKDEQDAARGSLYRLRGSDVNAAIGAIIPNSMDVIKIELIKSLGERGAAESVTDILKLTKDKNADVRESAIKVLGQLATPDFLPQLLDVLEGAKTENEKNAAILSTALTAKKITPAEKQAELILQKMNETKNDNYKSSLILTLGKIGADNSLSSLRNALNSDNKNIKISAIKALSEWPNDTPINDLLNTAKTSTDNLAKILSLRGFITLIDRNDERDDNESVKLYQQAMKLADRSNEKRMALSGLSDIRTVEALNAALSYLPQKDVQNEVETAVVRIAGRIRRDHPQEAKKALEKIISVTQSDYIKNKAQNELQRIK